MRPERALVFGTHRGATEQRENLDDSLLRANIEDVRRFVRLEYDRLAREPRGIFSFHVGPAYACRVLGYDSTELALLPRESTVRFSGMGNPHRIGGIERGETILDVGCGAGVDLLLASRLAGSQGRAIGVDMTPAMLELTAHSALKAGVWEHVAIRRGFAEDLPVESDSVDVVISNGVFSLSADQARVFEEAYRVLKPGGRLCLADVAASHALPRLVPPDIELWTACIAGALTEAELDELARSAGFAETTITERFDCHGGTAAATRLPKDFRVHGVNFFARKPISNNRVLK
jgi:ubiquinone/menaquinone biosynthesis C-methylase UbiE